MTQVDLLHGLSELFSLVISALDFPHHSSHHLNVVDKCLNQIQTRLDLLRVKERLYQGA